MAHDKERIRQEGEEAADASEQTISEAVYLEEDAKDGRKFDQVISKIEDKLPDSEGVKEAADKVKERVVQMKDQAQSLGTRATEAVRRVRPASSPATGVGVGGALAGSLWLLLRRRNRTRLKSERAWKKAALGLGALFLIRRKVRSRRRG